MMLYFLVIFCIFLILSLVAQKSKRFETIIRSAYAILCGFILWKINIVFIGLFSSPPTKYQTLTDYILSSLTAVLIGIFISVIVAIISKKGELLNVILMQTIVTIDFIVPIYFDKTMRDYSTRNDISRFIIIAIIMLCISVVGGLLGKRLKKSRIYKEFSS